MKRQVEGSKKGKRFPPRNKQGIGKVLVLDYYPQGKSLSRSSAEAYNPLAVVISINRLGFFDIILARGKNIQAGQTLDVSTIKSDVFKIKSSSVDQLLGEAETIGFVDSENIDASRKLYFNGNLFRRDETIERRHLPKRAAHGPR